MKLTAFLLATCLSAQAFAQASTEVVAPGATVTTQPGATVTTIVQTPDETTTTKVTSTGGQPQSQIYKQRDGKRLEVDSDQSAYIVYDDGARTTALDGIHQLLGGANITIKNGKRIP